MARLYYVISSVTPEGRPIPASVLFNVNWQNDEFEKETNGTEITNAILSSRSRLFPGDTFELPIHAIEMDMPGLPIDWDVILGTGFNVTLEPGHYVEGFLYLAGTVSFGFSFSQRLGVGIAPEVDSMTESDDEPPDDFAYFMIFTEEILDEMSSISATLGNNVCFCQVFLNGDFGTVTDFHFRAAYTDII